MNQNKDLLCLCLAASFCNGWPSNCLIKPVSLQTLQVTGRGGGARGPHLVEIKRIRFMNIASLIQS